MPLKKVPLTEARETLSSLLDEVEKSGEPVAITRHGRPAAVLMNMEALEQKMSALEKRPWTLRNSGTWVGEATDIEKAIRKVRKEFSVSSEKRLKNLSKKLAGK